MSWLYGFEFKYRFVKRIGDELGYRKSNVVRLDIVAQKHIRRLTRATFSLESDYMTRMILTFHRSKYKDKLDDMEATPEQIKEVGKIFRFTLGRTEDKTTIRNIRIVAVILQNNLPGTVFYESFNSRENAWCL